MAARNPTTPRAIRQ